PINVDTFGTPSLTLKVRLPKGPHEGQAHVPTEYPPPQENPRFSGADEHQERPSRAETTPSQGPQTSHGQQRITVAPAALRPQERIRRRAEFQQIYTQGARIHGRYSTIFVLANTLKIGRL